MRTVKAVLLHPDGNAEIKPVSVDLEALQGLVGGYIEPIVAQTGEHRTWHAYVDEEGKYKNAPINNAANLILTRLGWLGVAQGDYVVGTVVLLGSDGSEEADVPEDAVNVVAEFYGDNPNLTLTQ